MQLDLGGTAVLSAMWVGLELVPQFDTSEICMIVTIAAFCMFHLERQWKLLRLQRRIDAL